ncbi:respiratory nitrate reductase subunit gamma [Streptomyces sp. NPDC003077]|uniref:respiratory nitrate reductase subunit gamma n=1 Tax=Streptomyces sp. NPDC003077 TaxID=3154443 RepID=UPI0033BC939C
MNHLHTALWGVLPYLCLVLFVAGTVWRFRHDRFGITTRSSQLHEHRLLRVASPLFHYGLLFVIGGHVVGLLVPETLTERLRVSESTYHAAALALGSLAGLATVGGFLLLMWRRVRVRAVRRATTRGDLALFPLLATVLVGGLVATVTLAFPHPYDYRAGLSVWFRSLFALDPAVPAMAHAPFVYQLHTLLAMLLFALWPFSRLIHAFAAPIGYLVRPYVVYRSRAGRARGFSAAPMAAAVSRVRGRSAGVR